MSEGLKDDLNNKIAVPLAEDDFSDIDDYEDPNLAVDGANLWDVTACNTNDSNNNDDDAYIPAELKENESDCKVSLSKIILTLFSSAFDDLKKALRVISKLTYLMVQYCCRYLP